MHAGCSFALSTCEKGMHSSCKACIKSCSGFLRIRVTLDPLFSDEIQIRMKAHCRLFAHMHKSKSNVQLCACQQSQAICATAATFTSDTANNSGLEYIVQLKQTMLSSKLSHTEYGKTLLFTSVIAVIRDIMIHYPHTQNPYKHTTPAAMKSLSLEIRNCQWRKVLLVEAAITSATLLICRVGPLTAGNYNGELMSLSCFSH